MNRVITSAVVAVAAAAVVMSVAGCTGEAAKDAELATGYANLTTALTKVGDQFDDTPTREEFNAAAKELGVDVTMERSTEQGGCLTSNGFTVNSTPAGMFFSRSGCVTSNNESDVVLSPTGSVIKGAAIRAQVRELIQGASSSPTP
ncbi:hypothetical protein ET495_12660 [Xylanimonas allomyrinae]|uniref:Uncharacterized protein n=1 Tax=Xylanimonas allomyrinae TaxID=2509459 RepID=A0A4P6ENF0_9MICO|nr:hypothetical protein [Xylanimonas allomyrinae]QAY63936.1 hypothetical protein ET495_12660 [Xylanimonas allomyrinae]